MQEGTQIREYCLTSRLGVGGVGEVWKAHHVHLQQTFAIKIVHPHLLLSSGFRDRFLRVGAAQAGLDHPRIVRVQDFFVEDRSACLVLQFVEGESLRDRIDEAAPLASDEVIRIARDALEALDYAHRQAIFHRDVKPSNILLDREGRAYLSDFDTALIVNAERRTQTGATLGTSDYMSPEQIRAPSTVDQRADVYSMGCVLFEMLAARPPFVAEASEGDTDFVLKRKHLEEEPPPVRRFSKDVDAAIAAAIERALAKDPAQRYGGCHEFSEALTAEEAAPRSDPVEKRPARPSPGRRPAPVRWVAAPFRAAGAAIATVARWFVAALRGIYVLVRSLLRFAFWSIIFLLRFVSFTLLFGVMAAIVLLIIAALRLGNDAPEALGEIADGDLRALGADQLLVVVACVCIFLGLLFAIFGRLGRGGADSHGASGSGAGMDHGFSSSHDAGPFH